jgi:hypothetical protein
VKPLTVQSLVTSYKNETKDRLKYNILKDILKEYAALHTKMYKGIALVYHEDFRSFILTDLLLTIDKYDCRASCQFNTFYWYSLINIKSRFFKLYSINYIASNNEDTRTIDYQVLNDLGIDINKILTPQEIILLSLYMNNNIKKWVPQLEPLLTKLIKYMRDR